MFLHGAIAMLTQILLLFYSFFFDFEILEEFERKKEKMLESHKCEHIHIHSVFHVIIIIIIRLYWWCHLHNCNWQFVIHFVQFKKLCELMHSLRTLHTYTHTTVYSALCQCWFYCLCYFFFIVSVDSSLINALYECC